MHKYLELKHRTFKGNIFPVIPLYIILGFLFAYCALYTDEDSSLCRGINTGLVMALLVLIHNKDNHAIKLFVAISLASTISVFGFYQPRINERSAMVQNADTIVAECEALSGIIQISNHFDPWENTIVTYGRIDFKLLALPSGYGINWMSTGQSMEQARYALISRGDKGEQAYEQMLINSGHRIIYKDD